MAYPAYPELVAAVNPALAPTVKLLKVNPPRSHPAAPNRVTLETLMQLMASAPGGAIAQLAARRARERRRTFLLMRTPFRPRNG